MDDEQKQLKKRELGARAKQLRENELLERIFDALKSKYIREWVSTEITDQALREKKYMQMQALLDVHAEIATIIANGNAAAAFLEHQAKLRAA